MMSRRALTCVWQRIYCVNELNMSLCENVCEEFHVKLIYVHVYVEESRE